MDNGLVGFAQEANERRICTLFVAGVFSGRLENETARGLPTMLEAGESDNAVPCKKAALSLRALRALTAVWFMVQL